MHRPQHLALHPHRPATEQPYSATFLIGWAILFSIWLTLGFPVGPASPLSYPAAD
jgi:aminobenzoyl-glutamate transport protein